MYFNLYFIVEETYSQELFDFVLSSEESKMIHNFKLFHIP